MSSALITQAQELFDTQQYAAAAQVYETLLEAQPDALEIYQKLGLSYLLIGEEVSAQLAWFSPLETLTEPESLTYQSTLLKLLQETAQDFESQEIWGLAWLVRQHLRELEPEDLENIITIIELELKLGGFQVEHLAKVKFVEVLTQASTNLNQAQKQRLDHLLILLFPIFPDDLELTKCLDVIYKCLAEPEKISRNLFKIIEEHIYRFQYEISIQLLHRLLDIHPHHLSSLVKLSHTYIAIGKYNQGVEFAQLAVKSATHPAKRIYVYYILINALMRQGHHDRQVYDAIESQLEVVKALIEKPPDDLNRDYSQLLLTPLFYRNYVFDNPSENCYWRNQLATLAQFNFDQSSTATELNPYSHRFTEPNQLRANRSPGPLKIGYIGHTFYNHAVSILSRWLFRYHNHEKFKIHLYLFQQGITSQTQEWFFPYVDAWAAENSMEAMVKKIHSDQIDILIDLDAASYPATGELLAYKPAPIQVSWLGWDAFGLPAVDYFLADSYVLPDHAQAYYQEKIWRLPNSYLSVDGFEVGTPTLHRRDLDIADTDIIFMTIQNAMKHHPNSIKNQMQIIANAPNSYFLIRLRGNDAVLRQRFLASAAECGVAESRLRFLDFDQSDLNHRANLRLADVMLDTYPYNGATSTLETLWLEIPLVTQVGEQFAARNSYTFMKNAGINEGLAWSAAEYVEWGIRLGLDADLRQVVINKLRLSKRNAPIWNTREFVNHLESAYQQMWQEF